MPEEQCSFAYCRHRVVWKVRAYNYMNNMVDDQALCQNHVAEYVAMLNITIVTELRLIRVDD